MGSAGTAARFLTAMLGVAEGTFVIQASEQMKKRPMKPLFEALLSLGASVEWLGAAWHLPVRITGAGAHIRNLSEQAVLNLDISESTQFLSAFLLIAPAVSTRNQNSYYQRENRWILYPYHAQNDGRIWRGSSV